MIHANNMCFPPPVTHLMSPHNFNSAFREPRESSDPSPEKSILHRVNSMEAKIAIGNI